MLSTSSQSACLRQAFVFDTSHFPSCHASTLAETPSGLVAACFGGRREFDPGVGIWVSRLVDDMWTPPIEVANGVQHQRSGKEPLRYACWNPVLHHVPHGPLMLFYKVGRSPQTWWGMLTLSEDDGQTWSPPQRLPEGICGPVKNKPLSLSNGDLLCPASTEETMATGWRVHFERSSDLGKTWERTPPANDGFTFGAIQPSILRHSEQELQAIGRTQLAKRLFSVQSQDGGKTWGEMGLLHLPNPDSGTDAVTLADGRHALVYNHTTAGRSPLNLALSDDGEHWYAALVLESEPGEYSYPAIIQSADGLLQISYTWKRQKIKHLTVDPGRLEPKDISGQDWPEGVVEVPHV